MLLRVLRHPCVEKGELHTALTLTKPALLLCYLALQGDWVSRITLADLVRPDADEETARHQLRILLHRAKALPWAEGLEIEVGRVRFAVQTDVGLFREAIGQTNWAAALELYAQPLLKDATEISLVFDEWLLLERQRLHDAWCEALLAQTHVFLQSEQFVAAIDLLQRLLEQNEFDEAIVQLYMKTLYLAGQRETALQVFERFSHLLQTEMNALPSAETLEIQRVILAAKPLELGVETVRVPLEVLRPPSLIGRELPMQALRTTQAMCVVVTGEPGVGKTRFVQEVMPNAVLLRCSEGLSTVSCAPLLGFASELLTPANLEALGSYQVDLARLLPELPQVLDADKDSSYSKIRLLEALARLFEMQAQPLFFDDLQWADSSTLELLSLLLTRGKIRVFATIRTEALHGQLEQLLAAWKAERIALEPLSLAAVQVLLSSLVGREETYPVFAQFLFARSGGNSFFLLEMLRALFESGALRIVNGAWHSALDQITADYHEFRVPNRVSDLVLARVARLSETTKTVLMAASVLGNDFTVAALQHLTDYSSDGILAALEDLEKIGMIRGQRITHDLLRQSVYQHVSHFRKQHWHGKAALLLNLPRVARAEHYLIATQVNAAIQLFFEEILYRKRLGLLREAVEIVQRILQLEPENLEALVQSAMLYSLLGEHKEANTRATKVLEHSQKPEHRCQALNVQANLAFHQGRLSEAADAIEAALALAQTFVRTDADLEETAFDIFEGQARYEECMTILTAARTRLIAFGDSGDLSVIVSSLAAVYDDIGRYEEALELHFEALAIAKRCQARYAHVNAAVQIMWGLHRAKREQEAVQIGEEALALGEYGNTTYLRNGLGASYMHLGQLEPACHHYEHNTRHGSTVTQTLAWGRLAGLYHQLGRETDCQQAVAQALEYAITTEVPFARIRAAIAVLNHGSDLQLEQILPLIKNFHTPDTLAQSELEAALQARGIT